MKTIVLFNNKGGVGKTSLVYHLAWLFADQGLSVIAADLDPQANLTSMFLDEDRLEALWEPDPSPQTVRGFIDPILRGVGDIRNPYIENIADNLGLLCGDIGLTTFEDKLSDAWPRCLEGKEDAFRYTSAFYRIILQASNERNADLVLIDVGPNLGAINRAAIIAAQYVVVPLTPDLFSIQGLRNLGPTLVEWRSGWDKRLDSSPKDLDLPSSGMIPVGYVIMQHSIRLDRPAKAYGKWASRIPTVYREKVLMESTAAGTLFENDNYQLAMIKHYRSLMPMAMEARKPIFHLKPADGAIGAHMEAVQECRKDFEQLAKAIEMKCEISMSTTE
jgi:cellulose biosynthesis protein BcsQ